MSRIGFGFFVPTFCGGNRSHRDSPLYESLDWKTTEKAVLLCESMGYDSLWIPDHLILGKEGATFECWSVLSALAALTKEVRLGSLVLCNSYRHPSIVAKMAATVDVISNGRLEFGYGAGWKKDEYDAYGIQWHKASTRLEQMREGIEIIERMWTEEKPSYEGKYYRIEEAICNPKPIQEPHPPIWIGGAGEKTLLALVAKYADGWNWAHSVETMEHKLNVLRRHCKELGRDFDSIKKSWHGHVCISNDKNVLDNLFSKWAQTIRFMAAEGDPWLDDVSYENVRKLSIMGSAEECIKEVGEYVDLGVSHFMLWFIDYPSTEGIKLFAKEVMPSF